LGGGTRAPARFVDIWGVGLNVRPEGEAAQSSGQKSMRAR
jgi:hypothetical protein